MSTKLEYLKLAISDLRPLDNKNWYTYAIAIPLLKTMSSPKEHLALFTKPDGLYYTKDIGEEVYEEIKIVDYREGESLFKFNEKIKVDSDWCPNISKPMETTVGILIVNTFLMFRSFGNKVPYINEPISTKTVDNLIIDKLRDEDKISEGDIRPSEMIVCYDRLTFLSSLATIVNVAATKKTITPPEGLDKKKKELLAKYEGQLDNHVKLLEYENELDKIDSEYLADDPDASKILTGKTRTARRKMYLGIGKVANFGKEGTPILSSLSDGVDVDRVNFPQTIDDSRYGSYSRGASTAKSGYTGKLLQRALTSLSISNNSCDTKRGLTREITSANSLALLNRSVKVNGKWKIVTSPEEGKAFEGKEVEIRSAMYCTSPRSSVCYSCMSESYRGSESGVTNLAATFSDALMTLYLKAMHATSVSSTVVTIDELCN